MPWYSAQQNGALILAEPSRCSCNKSKATSLLMELMKTKSFKKLYDLHDGSGLSVGWKKALDDGK